MAQVSVIVPIYKVEKYINRCIDSILSQTFSDYDLILIDDGSPDRCPSICDYYASIDKRIHVIHQQNSGLSAARNAGIEWSIANSDSQWITFVDSDDWIEERMLEILYNAIFNTTYKICICQFETINNNESPKTLKPYKKFIADPEKLYLHDRVNATVAWGKLYAKECFSNIRYPNGRLHEDEFVTYKILFEQELIMFISAPLYFYYQNTDGIMNSKWNIKHLDALEAFKEQIIYFEKEGFMEARDRSIKALIWETKNCFEKSLDLGDRECAKYLRSLLRKEIRRYKKIASLSYSKSSDLYEITYPTRIKIYYFYARIISGLCCFFKQRRKIKQ